MINEYIALQVMGQGAKLLRSDIAGLLILSERGGTVVALSRVLGVTTKSLSMS